MQCEVCACRYFIEKKKTLNTNEQSNGLTQFGDRKGLENKTVLI